MVWKVRGSNSGRTEIFFSFRKLPGLALGYTQPSLQGKSGLFWGKCARNVLSTTHFHLPPRPRMNGAVLLPLYIGSERTDDFTSALYPWQCVVRNDVSCSVLSQHGNSETFQLLTKTEDVIACKTTEFTDLLYVMLFAWVCYIHAKNR